MLPVPVAVEPGRDAVLPGEVLHGPQERARPEGAAGAALIEANAMLARVLRWVIHGVKYAGMPRSTVPVGHR